MKRNTTLYWFIFVCSILIAQQFYGQNLISNGNFEQGFNFGFQGGQSPNYNYVATPTGNTSAGDWAIGTNPQPYNTGSFVSSGDHTSGTGNMMIVDGTNIGGQQRFYRAGNNGGGICGLTVGVTYTFSYWIRSIFTSSGGTYANIGIQFNNVNNIQLISGSSFAPITTVGWQQVRYTFIATNACVNIEMFNNNTDFVGNDFAIDDISLTPPPQPLSITFSTNSVSCFNANDGFISIYPKGGTLPYTSYVLSGPVNISNNTGIFSNLPPGVYSITVFDSNNSSISQNNITITQPSSIGITPNQTICSGDAVNLFVTGVTGSVTWSANPTDSSISNPNANPLNVSPTQSTVYTATVNNQTNLNLITNGNFSSGNFGFYSDLNFGTPPPSGAQRIYSIVTNPNAWFAGFPPCPSDPTNTNPMMVVDGSTLNGGNDAVWCQTVRVKPNQLYNFSYRVRSLVSTSPAQLQVEINGIAVSGIQLAPNGTCTFDLRSINWNSTTNEIARICIYNRNVNANGNDFALDDIEFTSLNICESSISTNVSVGSGTVVTGFSYTSPVCQNSPNLTPLLANNFTPNGSFSAIPSSGLSINSSSGAINLASSIPGTYTITYQVSANPTNCLPAGSSSFDITITQNIDPVTSFSYVVPNCQSNSVLNPVLANNFTTGGTFSSPVGLIINSSTGAIDFGASTPGSYEVTYSISPNNFNCINGGSSSYIVTINSSVTSPVINILSQPNCGTPSGGSFQINSPIGTEFEYSINGVSYQSNNVFNNLAAGNYTLTVRNINSNCSNSTVVTINSIPPITFEPQVNLVQPSCNQPTGEAQVTNPIGVNFEYSLDNISFQSSVQFTNLTPGSYTIYAREISTQCVASGSFVIENSPNNPPLPIISISHPNCVTSGSIEITSPIGSDFEYSINNVNFQSSPLFENLTSGSYTITVRNTSSQCLSSQNFVINNPPSPPAQAATTITHPTCAQLGSITILTPIDNNLVYSIDGTNFQPEQIFNNLTSGNYTITVQNTSTFCTSTVNVTINPITPNPSAPVLSNITQPSCINNFGSFTISSPVGSNFEYSLDLINFQNSNSFLNLTSGSYSVYVRDITTSCISNSTSISILSNLGITPGPVTPLQVCDANNDGFALFDLTIAGASAAAGNPDYLIAYFETFDDADFGASANQITNPSVYNSVNNTNQTVYIRVTSQTTGCHVVVPVTLVANPTPEGTTPDNLTQCDDNTDGIGVFNLNTVIPQVLGSISAATHTVSFHSTEAAAIAGTPSITNTNAYSNTTANQEVVWIRVTNNTTGCFDVVPLTLVVHPNPVVNATSLSLCDANNPGDQQEVFDLTAAITSIVSNPNGLSFAFYTSQANAQNGTNAIGNPTAYTNTSNVQAIWVVVTNDDTGCRNITLLDLRVEPLPMVQLPTPLPRECDADGDGFAIFDLDALISGLQNGASDVDVTFHETQQNAIDNVLAVSGNYQTIFPFLQTIYIRATNTSTGCFQVFDLLLTVEAAPSIPANLPDITLCDADSNPYNGFTAVNLSQQTPLILVAQSGPASQYSVRYFTSEAAAQANTGAIVNPGSFINTQNPQTIWVRVTDLATNCFNVDSFQIIINTPLQPIFPTPLTLCDESLPNNQQTEFDLTVKIPEILQGQAGYTVTFYPTFQNAQNNTNAIANPTAYTNPTGENPKTLGVRITNTATGCVSFTTLTIRVEPLPEPRMDPEVLEACENAFGSTQSSFDLTEAEDYIRNNDANLTFAYFTTLSDAQNNTNAIADPTNHVASTGEVYVRVANNRVDYTGSNCFVIVTLPIQVNPIPTANAVNYPNCEVNTDGFNTFNLLDSAIVAQILGSGQNPSDFTLTYFADVALTVAINNPTNYTNTTVNTQEVYVVVTNQATQCSNTAVVTLFVEDAPQTFPVTSSTSFCDTDGTNDGITTIDLTQYDNEILGNSTNPDFVVYYYDSLATANGDMNVGDFSNAIGNPNAYTNSSSPQQTLYAVAVNTATTSGCPQLITLNLTINTLPETTPQDGTVCLDPNTGVVVTPYIINSGLSSATHSFVWTDSTGNVVGNDSSYTATQAGVYTVVATSLATNCASEPQSAIVIESSIAMVSYELSNAFSENQTVTITATGITVPNQSGANFVYSLDFGPFQTSNVFTNLTPGEHTVEVRDENGCGSFVFTFSTIDYPKYFTPNADSYNDHWNIIGLGPQHQAKIYIFDRYGKLLKQISPSSIGWDGNFLGNPLPSTDYWFKVEYLENNQNKEFKAHFTLKR